MTHQHPLHHAVLAGSMEELEAALRQGADPDGYDERGVTPLHLAAGRGLGQLVDRLLGEGALVDPRNWYGQTPLHLAALLGQGDTARQLLAHGADPLAVDHEGRLPASLAASRGHHEAQKVIEQRARAVLQPNQQQDAASSHQRLIPPTWRRVMVVQQSPPGGLLDTAHDHRLNLHHYDCPLQARQHAPLFKPKVIFVQSTLPFEQGVYTWLRDLNQAMGHKPPSLVLLYEHESQLDRVQAVQAGVRRWLPLPLDAHDYVQCAQAIFTEELPQTGAVMSLCDGAVSYQLDTFLGAAGFEHVHAKDPGVFWEALARHQPEVLLVDRESTPGFLEVCKSLRREPRWRDLPVIALVGEENETLLRALFRAGVDDYVKKPLHRETFLARLGALLGRQRAALALVERDHLTGVLNRQVFTTRCEAGLARAVRSNFSLTLGLVKLANLQEINKSFGHLTGDLLLQKAGRFFNKTLRDDDLVCRWTGSVFALALPFTGKENAERTVQRLLEQLEKFPFYCPDGTTRTLSLQAGLATFPLDGHSFEELMHTAAHALALALREKAAMHSHVLPGHLAPVDIGVAEDDKLLREIIFHTLHKHGYTTEALTSQHALYERFGKDARTGVRLLVADLDMPGLHGPTLLQRLRPFIMRQGLKVLFIAPPGEEESLVAGFSGAAVDFVTKPVSVPVLLHRVQRLLG